MNETNRFAILVGDMNILYELSSGDHALFVSIGIAISEIQSLETQLASLLQSLERLTALKDGNQQTSGKGIHYSEKTLGTVIRLFREYIKDESIAQTLETARQARNHVVHHILRKYGWPFLSASEYFDAIREVDESTRSIASAREMVIRYMAENRPIPFYAVVINYETGEIEVIRPKTGSTPE